MKGIIMKLKDLIEKVKKAEIKTGYEFDSYEYTQYEDRSANELQAYLKQGFSHGYAWRQVETPEVSVYSEAYYQYGQGDDEPSFEYFQGENPEIELHVEILDDDGDPMSKWDILDAIVEELDFNEWKSDWCDKPDIQQIEQLIYSDKQRDSIIDLAHEVGANFSHYDTTWEIIKSIEDVAWSLANNWEQETTSDAREIRNKLESII